MLSGCSLTSFNSSSLSLNRWIVSRFCTRSACISCFFDCTLIPCASCSSLTSKVLAYSIFYAPESEYPTHLFSASWLLTVPTFSLSKFVRSLDSVAESGLMSVCCSRASRRVRLMAVRSGAFAEDRRAMVWVVVVVFVWRGSGCCDVPPYYAGGLITRTADPCRRS